MELTSLKNIGKEMQRKLTSVGITDSEVLRQLGSKESFFRLKLEYPEVCLVHLYVLEGAISGVEFNMLTEDVKQELKTFSDSL